ncbi:ABC transporter F family member 4-like [Apis laboriosa]|uniref:ABC transporter F family member 4-like n=1 Tax=Apis laboriosa TaxID=183418 RepID=UPI001CC4B657|nr:ABC transporter F family member 4-like [Apis laboriosa]
MNVAAILLLVTSVPWVIGYPGINEKSEEAKIVGQREPLGLFESVTAWSNKIFPFQFLNGKAEDSKKLDAQKEDNGERVATSPLEKIFGKDNIFASMISNVIGTIGKAIEGIASNVQKGIGLPFFPNREKPAVDVDKSDSGHSKRYGSREASVKEEGGRRVGYRESTEGAKEIDGEKRAIHSAAPLPSLEGFDAKTGGGERKRWDGPAVSTGPGGGSGDAKSWSHSSQGIEKNSLTSAKEESSSTNVDERGGSGGEERDDRSRKGGGGGETEEVKDKVARESIEVKEEGKKAKEKVDAKGKRDKVEREEKGRKDEVGEKTEEKKVVEEEEEETKKVVKEEEEKEKGKRKKKKD